MTLFGDKCSSCGGALVWSQGTLICPRAFCVGNGRKAAT